jgi:hypothetical protein
MVLTEGCPLRGGRGEQKQKVFGPQKIQKTLEEIFIYHRNCNIKKFKNL